MIPAYPTIREMAGDAWEELSGYDGRFVRSFKTLLRSPGAITLDVLEGRRARYVSPVRLYLLASVVYFIVAAASPNLSPPIRSNKTMGKIDLSTSEEGVAALPPEVRQQVERELERLPWWLKDVLHSAVYTPGEFRRRFLMNLPRVLFALVPVYAAIVGVFYRRGRFLVHLIFSLHLHTTIFLAFSVAQLSNFPRSVAFATACGLLSFAYVLVYALLAFRRVYGERWPMTLAKVAGIAVLYFIAGMCALTVTFVWAALT